MPSRSTTKAPPGSPGRRRRGTGPRTTGSNFRLGERIATALEAESRETGVSKVMIVERALERELRRRLAA